ncbi:MAG TPA: sugar ABC transporter substrate-binding protein [Albitalea sp.]|nr:sugar ABC transporter substrate-binding protein [Albitalea sp.]
MRRSLIASLLLLPLAALLAGCTRTAPPEQVIHLWAMGREGEVVAELLPEFERSHPGIRVKVQQLPWTAAHEKLLTAYAGGAMPDLAQMGNTWLPEMAALHALEPLDAWIARSQVVRPADYFAGIWSTNVIDGVAQGVPWYVDTRLLFYRRDLLAQAGFDHPPASWDEWRRMMAAIKARSAGHDRWPILLPLNEFEPLLALGLQQEEPLLRDGGRRGNFSGAGFRRALGFYADMFAQGWAPGVTNTQISNVWNEIGRGRFVFYISGPWNIGEFKRRLPPESQAGWTTAPLPGPHGPGASIAGGSSLVMFRSAHHKPEAWALIEYLSRPETQRRFHALTGDLPPRRATWADPALATDPYARAFRDQLERVVPAPAVPEWERIANEMQLMAARTVSSGADIGAATAQFDAQVDALLEKRRWMLDRREKAAP